MWVLFGFFLHVLRLLPIRFTQQNSCCISKPPTKHMQKPYRKLDLPCFRYDSRKCMFVDILTIYPYLFPLVFTIECRVVINICQISFKHVSLWCLLFGPCRTTYQPSIKVQLRKVTAQRPHNLIGIHELTGQLSTCWFESTSKWRFLLWFTLFNEPTTYTRSLIIKLRIPSSLLLEFSFISLPLHRHHSYS